jgi:hypothetical protein
MCVCGERDWREKVVKEKGEGRRNARQENGRHAEKEGEQVRSAKKKEARERPHEVCVVHKRQSGFLRCDVGADTGVRNAEEKDVRPLPLFDTNSQ